MGKRWKQWQIFILGGSKINADGDCSHEIKRCLLLGNDFIKCLLVRASQASQVALVVKNLPANTGDIRHVGLILGQEDLLEEGDPLQYSCLENPVDRGAW